MSEDKTYLEQRVEELEKKVAELTETLASMKHSITVTSPDGENSIALTAMNSCSGIWVSGKKGEPMVAIYNDRYQGAVVGIYGKADDKGHRRGAIDACLAYDANVGGQIMLTDKDNKVHWLEPKSISEGSQLLSRISS